MTATRGASSARLTYMDLGRRDIGALARLVSDWQVVEQLGSWPWPPNPALTAARARPFAGAGFGWGIRLDDRMIGTVGVDGGGHLGYMLMPEHWGQGYATEASATAIDYAFATRDLTRILADVWEDNAASAKVLEKLGFAETGSVPGWSRARRAQRVRRVFALSRADWRLPPDAP